VVWSEIQNSSLVGDCIEEAYTKDIILTLISIHMKKSILLFALLYTLTISHPVYAQMLGMAKSSTSTDTSEAAQEEAEGKAVWDKLQSKEVTCKDLTDDDFDVLADFFMGNMMGANHEAMNEMMAERLGDEGETQLHVAMGKRLSGCDTSAAFPDGSNYFMPMLGMGHEVTDGNKGGFGDWNDKDGDAHRNMMSYGAHGAFGSLFALGAFIFLILGSIFFWKGIKQK
jgi:hypothetical protein